MSKSNNEEMDGTGEQTKEYFVHTNVLILNYMSEWYVILISTVVMLLNQNRSGLMAVSYKKLFKLMIDRDIKKKI